MGKVYRDVVVPIPSWAVRGKNGYIYDGPGAGRNPETVLIGYAVSDNTMHPNENYVTFYFKDYIRYVPDNVKLKEATLYAGLYLLILGIAKMLGLYEAIASVFGCTEANACMDYVMYMIASKENSTYTLVSTLKRKITFTSGPLSSPWYSGFFSNKENEEKVNIVLDEYLKRCVERGITSVYLSLDGTNIECDAEKNRMATPGKSKTGKKGVKVVNLMWVVCAEGKYAGTPITYVMNKGKFIDSKMMREVIAKITGFGIKIKGIICDRGFCFSDVMNLLKEAGVPYIIMLTSNTLGYKTVREKYADTITGFPMRYYIKDRQFGIADSEKYQIFDNDNVSAYIALLYKPEMAARTGMDLVEEVFNEKERIEDNIKSGKRAAVDKKFSDYIQIIGRGKGRIVLFDYDKLEDDANRKGYSAIASSEQLTAKEIAAIYRLRQASERDYSSFKTELGGYVLRVHGTESAVTKMFVEFIAAIIRNEIVSACKPLKLATNKAIDDLDEVRYILNNGVYKYADVASESVLSLLNACGIPEAELRGFASEVTRRYITLPGRNQATTDIFSEFPWKKSNFAHEQNSNNAEGKSEQKSENQNNFNDENVKVKEEQSNIQNRESNPDPAAAPKRKRRPGGGRKPKVKDEETLRKQETQVKNKGGRPKGTKDSKPRVRRTKAEIEAAKKAGTYKTKGKNNAKKP